MKTGLIKNLITIFLSSLLTIFLIDFIFDNEYKKLKISIKDFLSKESVDETCLPKIISEIPINSNIVIGHAYGSKKNDYISEKVKFFLDNQKNNILSLILTGDVFDKPSLNKWNKLYQAKEYKIYVAPGNHDVGNDNDNARRDVFNIANAKNQIKDLPYILMENNSAFVITDSSKNPSNFEQIINLIKEYNDKHIIFFMHHVSINEMNRFANSKRSTNQIFDTKFLEKKLSNYKKVTFIYGDGGTGSLPRIACYQHANINHIINGIGDKNGDKLLIIKNNEIYQYEL